MFGFPRVPKWASRHLGKEGGSKGRLGQKPLGGLVKRTSRTKNPSEGLVKRTSWTKTVVRCCLKGFGGGRYPTAAPLHPNLADTPFIPTARIFTGEPVNRKSNPLGMLRLSFSRSIFKAVTKHSRLFLATMA